MCAARAVRENVEGEDLCLIRIDDGTQSRAWSLYEEWASGLGEVDPLVLGMYSPSNVILGTALAPPAAAQPALLNEVNSIINHFAPLLMGAFAAGMPVIPGPIPAPQMPIQIHHAKVAVCGLVDCIQNAPVNYPAINGLGSGSYTCTLMYVWTGAAVTVAVFKP